MRRTVEPQPPFWLTTVLGSIEEVWVTGHIDSMDKSTGGGYIQLRSRHGGGRVPYKIRAEVAAGYYSLFGHPGPVDVRCLVRMDEHFKAELDVIEMIPEVA